MSDYYSNQFLSMLTHHHLLQGNVYVLKPTDVLHNQRLGVKK